MIVKKEATYIFWIIPVCSLSNAMYLFQNCHELCLFCLTMSSEKTLMLKSCALSLKVTHHLVLLGHSMAIT